MKLLDDLNLENLCEQLSRASRRYVIDVRLENYSCKMVSEEKRQYKDLVLRLKEEGHEKSSLRLGPSRTIRGLRELTGQPIARSSYQMSSAQVKANDDSSFASSKHHSGTASSSEDDNLCSPSKSFLFSINSKDLFCLISTLNLSFGPSYDFITAESEEFCLEPEICVIKNFISRLCSIYVDKYEILSPQIWKAVDEAIYPHECIIYSESPVVATLAGEMQDIF